MLFNRFAPLLLSALATAAPLASDFSGRLTTTALSKRESPPSDNKMVVKDSIPVEARGIGKTIVDGVENYVKTLHPKRSEESLSIENCDVEEPALKGQSVDEGGKALSSNNTGSSLPNDTSSPSPSSISNKKAARSFKDVVTDLAGRINNYYACKPF